MSIEPNVAMVILSAMLALQGWTLASLVDLKIKVAAMAEHCKMICEKNDMCNK
jgi:uncharacterized membrane protein